ncbi:unnamed protein product [Caenorhabditis angaria]|uniref:ShKT domain-containing protein n=1 Tax=Caenorhabditis angaria TaxID=860376 RepID=A0A9P1IW57_9PELO|nr:unnamed protein product [Caenorhabditis angaria]
MKSSAFLVLAAMNVLVDSEINSNLKCVDVSMECEYRARYCYNPNYTGLMFKMCRSTCDWCHTSLDGALKRVRRQVKDQSLEFEDIGDSQNSSVTPTGTCMDHSQKCEATAALCTSSNYQSIMAIKCPKTCGVC